MTGTSSAQVARLPSTAEEFVAAVRSLLADGKAGAARRTAAEGLARFPDDSWLTKANRVINPTKVASRPADACDRTREFAWLRENGARYRGSWIALLKDELLASGPKLEDVLRVVRRRGLEADALVHRIV